MLDNPNKSLDVNAGYVYLLVHQDAIPFWAKESLQLNPGKLPRLRTWLHMARGSLHQTHLSATLDLCADDVVAAIVMMLKDVGVTDEQMGI